MRALRLPTRLVLLIAALVCATGGIAYGYITATTSAGSSDPTAQSDTLPQGAAPAASVSGQDVTVTVTQSTFRGGPLAHFSSGGYRVLRYAAGSPTGVTPGGTCASPLGVGSQVDTATISCSDSTVAPGSYTYTATPVLATNWRGAESAASSSVTVAQLTAPTIDGKPANPSNSSSASFSFSGGGSSSYECQIDAGSFVACTSPKAYSGLAEGPHTFTVHSRSGSVTGPDASYTWTVDLTRPSVVIAASAGQQSPTNQSPIRFAITLSETPNRDLVVGDANVSVPNSVAVTKSLTKTDATHYVLTVGGLPANTTADGNVTTSIAANAITDAAGNGNTAGSGAVVYDRTAPTVAVSQAADQPDPTNALPIHFTATFSEAVATPASSSVVLGGTAGRTGATIAVTRTDSTHFDIAVGGLSSNGTLTASLSGGASTDTAGNLSTTSTSTDNTVTYDTMAPGYGATGVQLMDGGSSTSWVNGALEAAGATVQVTLSNNQAVVGDIVTVALRDAANHVASGAATISTAKQSTISISGIATGSLDAIDSSTQLPANIAITATVSDPAGNASTIKATASIGKDVTAPGTPSALEYADNKGSDGVSGSSEANATVSAQRTSPTCSGGCPLFSSSLKNGLTSFAVAVDKNSSGPVTYDVWATDPAGNVGVKGSTGPQADTL